MTTIISGSASNVSVTVLADGNIVPLDGQVSARVLTLNGRTTLVDAFDLSPSISGAEWSAGLVVVPLTADQTEKNPTREAMLVLSGGFGIKRFKLVSESLFEPTSTSLFIKDLIVEEMRNDRLVAAAAGALQDVQVSDDYIWQKVRAAESEISHTLRVPLVPTHYFPLPPTDEQIEALDGMAWDIDPAYDYSADMFRFEKWGFLVVDHRPVIDVIGLRFAYPSASAGFIDIPNDWIRIDARYGHIRLVPSSPAVFAQMDTFIMMALAGSQSIPNMIQLEYTAGLTDVEDKFPELLDAIKKKAVLKIIGDAFLPQSGSISSDGLSQSMSVDMSKYADSVEEILNGPPGSNGGLMTKINGIRLTVM